MEEDGSVEEESLEEEEGSMEEEALVEEEVPVSKKKSQVGTSHSLTAPLVGPMFEVSMMTKDDIIKIRERFWITDGFHLHVLRLKTL